MLNKLAIKSTKAAVMSLECQLAQVQIKRFLNGDNIPEDLLKDLEQHLVSCSDCLAVAKGERAAVESHMVATPGEVVQIRQKAPATSVFDVFKQPKTLLLSAALGVVLILMSTIMRDPTKFLGGKAIAAHPAATKEEPTSEEPTSDKKADEKTTEDVKKPVEPETKPTESAAPTKPEEHQAEPPKTSTTTQPHDEQAGHSTPPGPAAAAVKAAQEAAKKNSPSMPGKPTLSNNPILEVTEGKATPAKPAATAAKTPAPKRTTTRRTTTRPKPKSEGGVTIYKD